MSALDQQPDVEISMSWLTGVEVWLLTAKLDGNTVWSRTMRSRSTIEKEDVRVLADALAREFEAWAAVPW